MSSSQIVYKEGKKYIIDSSHANAGEVEIVKLIGSGFALVKDIGDDFEYEWTIDLKRLSKIENQ